MDRLLVTDRFCCTGLNIARRDEITRMPGVQGAAALQWVCGFHQEPSMRVGVLMLDQASTAALPELRLTPEHWKQMAIEAHRRLLQPHAGRRMEREGRRSLRRSKPHRPREDGTKAWPFEVLGIVDDPESHGRVGAEYLRQLSSISMPCARRSQRGTVRFMVADRRSR